MKNICPHCEKETEVELVKTREVLLVQGESVEVEATPFKCLECEEMFEDPKSERDPLDEAYRIYRQRHNLLSPEEIASFRKRYGLTQMELSKLLGWGAVTLSRYENGALQDTTHDKALRLALDPRNLLALIQQSPEILSDEKRSNLVRELELAEEEAYSLSRIYEERFGRYEADILSGYRKLDLGKLLNAIIYFCQDGVLKTVLNKLLFYADFVHYREYAISITGVRYAHIPFGPAPDKYAHYFAELVDEGFIAINEIDFGGGVVGEQYTSTRQPDLSIYTASELKILATIKERFKTFSASKLSELSHKERGYLETNDGEIISYDYAEDIKLL